MLVVLFTGVLDVGKTAPLVWTELSIVLKTLSSLLLEVSTRVLRVTCVERTKVSVTDVGGTVTEVGMTVIEGTDITVEVTTPVAADIRVLSIPVVDFFDEVVDERELNFIETVLLASNNVVEFCTILMDSVTSLLLSKVVRSCDFKGEDAELEVSVDDSIVRLICTVDIPLVVEFNTEISVVRTPENAALDLDTATELLTFAINMEDDPRIGFPLKETVDITEELASKCPLELVTKEIGDEVVLFAETDEFIGLATALDTAAELPLVLEAVVEFTGISGLVVCITDIEKNDECVTLVKFGLRSTLENMLAN